MLLLLFFRAFGLLDGALGVINLEAILPETFDLALVLLLAHAPFLCVHLLETLVFGELSHQLFLKLVLEAFLLSGTLSLKLELEVLGRLELLTDLSLAFSLGGLLSQGCFFLLLNVKFVTQLLLELTFSATRFFFSSQF